MFFSNLLGPKPYRQNKTFFETHKTWLLPTLSYRINCWTSDFLFERIWA